MDIFGSLLLAVLTFFLGLAASSYGAKVGKTIETRKELLDKMREWVDLFDIRSYFLREKILGVKTTWSDDEFREIEKKIIAGRQRWSGVAESIGSPQLISATEKLLKANEKLQSFHDFPEGLMDQKQKNSKQFDVGKIQEIDDTISSAKNLHKVITYESVQLFPRWLSPGGFIEQLVKRFKRWLNNPFG